MSQRGARVALIAAVVGAVLAVLALVGWTFHIPRLESALCSGAAMNPISAACIVAVAVAVIASLGRPRSAVRVRLGLALAVIGAGALRLGTDLGMMRAVLDEAAFGAALQGNRMAPNTATCLIAIGLALALPERAARRFSAVLLVVPGVSGWLASTGYLFHTLRLYGLPQSMPMALPTALALIAMSVAVACTRPTSEPFATILEDSAGGRIARRLVPVALVAPPLLGFLRLEAQSAGLLSPEAGVSLMAAALSFALLVSIYGVCRLVRQLDVERATAHEVLRELSLLDELTTLHNRRGFFEHARHQLALAQRNARPTVVCFIDLDGLKGINDTFGHEAGDLAIVSFARVLRSTFRETDVLARLGGDEFVVLALESADSRTVVARLNGALAAFNARASLPFELAASVGTAVSSASTASSIEALLLEADEQMYANKQARRAAKTSGRADACLSLRAA